MKTVSDPSHEDVRYYLRYEPLTGHWYWRNPLGKQARQLTGQRAGNVAEGRIGIRLRGKHYQASRLAWIYVFGRIPEGYQVDHINGDPLDNRIANLRLATHGQNCQNSRGYSRKGLPKGVTITGRNTISAAINVDRKKRYLGSFPTVEAAAEAYRKAAEAIWGEFARAD